MKFKCDCGRIFDDSEIRCAGESRGEFWGAPAFEQMAYCPECGDDTFAEIKFDDVYGTPVCENEEYYDFGIVKVAEENIEEYLSDRKCIA